MKNKKIFLVACTLSICSMVFSQANEKGNFNIDFGGGAGIYNNNTSYFYTIWKESVYLYNGLDGNCAYLNIYGEYSLRNYLSAGINYKTGFFTVEETEQFGNKHSLNEFGLQCRFYLINRDKFTFFGNVRAGTSYLKQRKNENEDPLKWNGRNTGLGGGFKWYFMDNIGIYLSYEFNSYSLSNGETKLNTYGSDVQLGLTFKL